MDRLTALDSSFLYLGNDSEDLVDAAAYL